MTARGMGNRAFALLVAAALATTGGALTVAQAATGDEGSAAVQEKIKKAPRGDKIGQHDRELLAEAVRKGKPTVTVMLATKRGAAKEVETSIKALGGTVGRKSVV